ncbi:MAG TPA: hypothetical protein ENK18_09595 [Deltaproteobacteria bacterium]|nr:hypothetical protein [Deltaproteobacteria bacterium]
MLLGSGGVIALVIGAWGVLWAIRTTPGRHPRTWYPQLVALAGLALGAALLSSHTTLALGIASWSEASPSARASAEALALSRSLRPLLGMLLALGAMGAAITLSSSLPSDVPSPPRSPGRAGAILSGGVGLVGGLGGLTYGLLRATASAAMESPQAAGDLAPRLQGIVTAGIGASVLLSLLAAGLGIWCVREQLRS